MFFRAENITSWPAEQTLQFIEEYKNRPELWDSSLVTYVRKDIRSQRVQELSSIFNLSPADVKKKINSLRTTFLEYTKKATDKYNGNEELYASVWKFYEPLSFLKNVINPFAKSPSLVENGVSLTKTSDVVERENKTDENDEILISVQNLTNDMNEDLLGIRDTVSRSQDYQDEQNTSTSEKGNARPMPPRTKKMPVKKARTIFKFPKSDLPASSIRILNPKSLNDEHDLYGQYIASEIRAITDVNQRNILKAKIQIMICKAHHGLLNLDNTLGD